MTTLVEPGAIGRSKCVENVIVRAKIPSPPASRSCIACGTALTGSTGLLKTTSICVSGDSSVPRRITVSSTVGGVTSSDDPPIEGAEVREPCLQVVLDRFCAAEHCGPVVTREVAEAVISHRNAHGRRQSGSTRAVIEPHPAVGKKCYGKVNIGFAGLGRRIPANRDIVGRGVDEDVVARAVGAKVVPQRRDPAVSEQDRRTVRSVGRRIKSGEVQFARP